MLDYSLEHICSYTATLGPPELIGEAAEGIRVIFYSTGGEVSGPLFAALNSPMPMHCRRRHLRRLRGEVDLYGHRV